MGRRLKDEGASAGRPGMGRIGVATAPQGKPGRLPWGVGGQKRSANRRGRRRRSVGKIVTIFAGAASATEILWVAGSDAATSRLTPRSRGQPRATRVR